MEGSSGGCQRTEPNVLRRSVVVIYIQVPFGCLHESIVGLAGFVVQHGRKYLPVPLAESGDVLIVKYLASRLNEGGNGGNAQALR